MAASDPTRTTADAEPPVLTERRGPVLTMGNKLIGMSTSGPRRRALVIPSATIERVLDPLLSEGRVARGWLGVALQRVRVPDRMRDAAGRDGGMMVIGLASGSPAEQAGVLPGDIILTGTPEGVGYFRDPKVTLRSGDVVEVEIEGIGVLSNPVIG